MPFRAAVMALALLGTGSQAIAQQTPQDGLAVLEVSVIDAATGRPLPSAEECIEPRISALTRSRTRRCMDVDTAGRYRFDQLPMGTLPIQVSCWEISTGFTGFHRLETDTVVITESSPVRRDWVVPAEGCDRRERRTVSDTFSGHYTAGFEESKFVPCPADAWFLPSDSLDGYATDARDAWVNFGDDKISRVIRSTDVPVNQRGYRRWFVRWRGTIQGPGRYGHLGGSAFELVVDSVLEVRAPTPDDCGQAGTRIHPTSIERRGMTSRKGFTA